MINLLKTKKVFLGKTAMKLALLALFVFGFVFFNCQPVFARPNFGNADSYTRTVAERIGVGDKADLSEVIGSVIKAGLSVVGVLFFLLIFYGGFNWMTARGNEQQIEKSKNTVIAAVIGLVVVLAAYAITAFVGNIFGA